MKSLFSVIFLLAGIFSIAQKHSSFPVEVHKAVYFDVSPPLKDMVYAVKYNADASWKDGIVKNQFNVRPLYSQDTNRNFIDPNRQSYNGQTLSDTTLQNFEGIGAGSYIPPDTDGDIGPNHYFQVVNSSFSIYNKNGFKLMGPIGSSTIWNGMPNNSNDGDAVVLYDETANRFMFTQFSLPNYPNGPFYQMIAVSQTPDPTGSWYRYEYTFATMPDYPKFGVWPDGYYMSCNRFTAGSGFYDGTGAAAFDRTLMLAGNPDAQMVWFSLPSSNEAFGMLPSDCDGAFPPYGTPNYFTYESNASSSHLAILEFQVNWADPGSSTLGNLLTIPVNTFSSGLGSGISQLGTNVKLATLSDRLMYRLQFRKFNDHWTMVCNHSVNAGSNIAGIRWYELRKTTGEWGIYQQSTYAPADNISRWMGSIAMDSAGNIAVGYSASGNSIYPSIRYTGRMVSDPLNQMTITERRIMDGGGCQTSTSKRWGDYSTMRVDASSPTTFWFSTEYYSSTSGSNWQTRIASFTFANIFTSFATANPVRVCIGDSTQLDANAYGGSGNYTYTWTSIPAGFTSTLRNPKVAPSDTTTYIAAVSDGTQTRYDTTRVMIIAPPLAFAGNDTTVCATMTSIDLHGTISNPGAFAWVTSGNGHFSSSSSLNTIYTFGTSDYLNGSVNLELVAFPVSPCAGNNISIKHIILDPCNGIPETNLNAEIVIIPNPARESAVITVNGLQNQSAVLVLTNIKGQKMLSLDIKAGPGPFSTLLDLHGYPAGTYILKISNGKKTISRQLVVY